ncbi:hypothetical protein SprV_0401705000 [Sparganum proliferum]
MYSSVYADTLSGSFQAITLRVLSRDYLRCDRVRQPPELPCDGLFRVTSCRTKIFSVQHGNREKIVHKDDFPLRPIVSLKGTPTYGLAKWLFRRLKFLTAESDTTVSSSTQFLEKLKGDLAIETIEQLLQSKYDETENRHGHTQVLQLMEFCLRTYFTFDGTIYDQVKDTPMGSPN